MLDQSKYEGFRAFRACCRGLLGLYGGGAVLLLAPLPEALADQDPACFDLSHKQLAGIMAPEPWMRPSPGSPHPSDEARAEKQGEVLRAGKKADNLYWAAVEGISHRSISDLIRELESHNATKAGRVSEMKIKTVPDPKFLVRQDVSFEVDPFPFVKIEWTESWAASLLKGTSDQPQQVLFTYEKVSGTSHIRHLCGEFELTKLSEGETQVSIYEEAKATGRNLEDTLSGTLSSLHKLQDKTP